MFCITNKVFSYLNKLSYRLAGVGQENFPKKYGLYELPVIIRKNTEKIKKLNLRWWEQICRFSSRDQISMPYVLWKTNVDIKILPGFANGGLLKNNIMPQVRIKGQ